MELYAGLDLHSRNAYIGTMDKTLNESSISVYRMTLIRFLKP